MALQINEPSRNSLDADEIEAWRAIPTSIVSDELNRACTPDAGIRPMTGGASLVGLASTVRTMAGDNLALHHAVARMAAGRVLVVDAGGYERNAVWGGILHRCAEARGAVGVVIDGAIRDSAEIGASHVACYARSVVPAGPHKGWGGEIDGDVQVGGAVIHPGDLVIGDRDGLAFVPFARRREILTRCQARIAMEADILRRIDAGETTVEIMGLKA